MTSGEVCAVCFSHGLHGSFFARFVRFVRFARFVRFVYFHFYKKIAFTTDNFNNEQPTKNEQQRTNNKEQTVRKARSKEQTTPLLPKIKVLVLYYTSLIYVRRRNKQKSLFSGYEQTIPPSFKRNESGM